jgi:hypothetical protein
MKSLPAYLNPPVAQSPPEGVAAAQNMRNATGTFDTFRLISYHVSKSKTLFTFEINL